MPPSKVPDPDRSGQSTNAPQGDESAGFDRGFEGHARRQARLGLQLTPAERLHWLEQTMEELRCVVGLARRGRALRPPSANGMDRK